MTEKPMFGAQVRDTRPEAIDGDAIVVAVKGDIATIVYETEDPRGV